MDKRNRRLISWTLVLLAFAIIVGIFIGSVLQRRQQAVFDNIKSPANSKIDLIMNLINDYYVDSVNEKQLVNNAIPDILKQLDPHTTYIPKKDMKEVNEEMSGNFGGIGVQFSIQNDTVTVVDVISGGPSQKLGIQAGDRIVMVNDTTIAGVNITNDKVIRKLRGEKGTHVKVAIARHGIPDLIDFDITRGNIPLYSVDVSYMIDKNTGYVKVGRFAENTYTEFMEALDKLNKDGANNIIIDLRGNPGGYLAAVIKMVSEFLDKGELIVYTKGLHQPKKMFRADGEGSMLGKKVVVMIDEFSASASEIFSGAIQDNDRGLIVGRRSFGKGLVQEQIPFSDGSAMRLTVARYYTPSGRSIQKPYDEGNKAYYQDIARRYQHGEFEQRDSIHFNDSLKYHTRTGRVVYGGGGIMPDVFVPADTTGFSDYYGKITSKGLVYRFAFDYADSHRELLSKMKEAKAIGDYLNKQNVFSQFVRFAGKNGVPRSSEGLKVSGKILKVQLNAYIARNILGEEGFYPIIKEIDTTLRKAISVIESDQTAEMKK
ncbi:S41 family peptidase [Prolixibacter sp. SD074]|uniref:S41 family peptidase n=1 Tax=Prolixibacter sp. SD074 TaxID=2652391 RepID=UPI001283946D|nr:S41 family peptidase [Prolixibacter sp. SD074]GET30495.1 peptidase S41 [Prolixibacter sp. SD074]